MDLKERILVTSYDLLTQYGISSVTMDFIAKECGISKRTLYEQFTDKNTLVVKAIKRCNEEQRKQFCKIVEEAPNRLIAILKMYSIIRDFIVNINPAFFFDMDRLYVEIANEYKELRYEHIVYFKDRKSVV